MITSLTRKENMSDYPSRVKRIYDHYAPDKAVTVPQILTKFAGREEELLASLRKKYGDEPPFEESAPTSPVRAPRKSVAPVPPTNQAPQQPPSVTSKTTVQPDQQTPPGGAEPSTLQPAQRQDGSSIATPVAIDPLFSLRHQVRTQIGFLTHEHELMWEDAWMGKMPLGTLRKTWEVKQSVIMAGQGWKMSSHARPVKRWQRRYFVLAPPFLYYFANDAPSSICKGALYLDRAVLDEDIVKERNAIIITSRVTKKPPVLTQGIFAKFGQPKPAPPAASQQSGAEPAPSANSNGPTDVNSFTISFDLEREQATWLDLLRKVVQLGDMSLPGKLYGEYPPNPLMMLHQMQAAGGYPGGGGANPMMANNPMYAQMMMMQQQQQQQAASSGATGRGAGTHSPTKGAGGQHGNAHGSNPYGWMMGFNNYNVDAPEIKRRIVRLARDRDPILMADVFLQFIQDHMENAQQLWKLMASLEEIDPYTGPTFQMNGMMGGGYGGIGGQQQMYGVGGGCGMGGMLGGGFGNPAIASMPYMRQQTTEHSSGINASFAGGAPLQQQPSAAATGGTLVPNGGAPSNSNPDMDLDRASLASLRGQFNQSGGNSALMRAAGRNVQQGEADDIDLTSFRNSQSANRFSSVYSQQPNQQMSFSSVGGDDGEWQKRLSRIRDRKQLVDQLVQDLPE